MMAAMSKTVICCAVSPGSSAVLMATVSLAAGYVMSMTIVGITQMRHQNKLNAVSACVTIITLHCSVAATCRSATSVYRVNFVLSFDMSLIILT